VTVSSNVNQESTRSSTEKVVPKKIPAAVPNRRRSNNRFRCLGFCPRNKLLPRLFNSVLMGSLSFAPNESPLVHQNVAKVRYSIRFTNLKLHPFILQFHFTSNSFTKIFISSSLKQKNRTLITKKTLQCLLKGNLQGSHFELRIRNETVGVCNSVTTSISQLII